MLYVMVGQPAPGAATTVRATGADGPLEARAAEGDRVALEALVAEHGADIVRLCHFLAGSAEATDVAQEVFERIVLRIGQLDPDRGSFRKWAFAVARNVCRDRLRRRALERSAFVADGEAPTAAAPAGTPDPERLAHARAENVRMEKALADLPAGMREAIVLFHVQGASYEDIAGTLGVPKGTVMTWLHRGRLRLRSALNEDGE